MSPITATVDPLLAISLALIIFGGITIAVTCERDREGVHFKTVPAIISFLMFIIGLIGLLIRSIYY